MGRGEEATEPLLAGVDTRYRHMLRQEMVQVEATARRLASHLARGEAELAAGAAAAIRDTLVLERSLTAAQREEMRQQLPAGYREYEESFRRAAGALAATAAAGDLEASARLYGQLLESCLACHSRYASGRFPGFGQPLGDRFPALSPGAPRRSGPGAPGSPEAVRADRLPASSTPRQDVGHLGTDSPAARPEVGLLSQIARNR